MRHHDVDDAEAACGGDEAKGGEHEGGGGVTLAQHAVGKAGGGGEGGKALCGAVAPRDAREIGRERGVREQRAEPAHLLAGRVRAGAGLG